MRNLILAFCFLGSLGACSYAPEPVSPNAYVLQWETPDYIVLTSALASSPARTALLFFPGGLVDPHAYIGALEELVAINGYQIVIPKVSANLAIWNAGKAKAIREAFPDVQNWVVSGHSLGGAVAPITLDQERDAYQGLILLAAYSVTPLADWEGPVMVISAELDEVGDPTDLTDNEGNLPPRLEVSDLSQFPASTTAGQTIYYEIAGGNHSGFGNYGAQEGDGVATISSAEQQAIVRDLIRAFMSANQL